MDAIILSIGDELVLGQTVDTNSAWLSQQLAAAGCGVIAHLTVADDQPAIEQAIEMAATRCGLLLISGGLGPTEDDLTRQALAAVMKAPLEVNEVWLKELKDFFAQRGREMPESNKIQAMIPSGAEMVFNHAGTAAGIRVTLGGACETFVMPGVPKEMKQMFTRDVLPYVRSRGGGAVILSRVLHTFGLGESAIAELLGSLMRRGNNPSVGTTVSGGVVSLRINARFASADEAKAQLERTTAACRAALGDLIYGQDEQTLAEVVARLLIGSQHHPTVTTAESCTGGLLAKMLTDVAGSSAYFHRGWVTYANEAKQQELAVPAELLEKHGAVSEPVVLAMADGAVRQGANPIALAISGVAGPTGGTPEKPVGTVWIALSAGVGASPSGQAVRYARKFNFPGDREMIRDRSAKMALTMLRFHLLGKPLPF